MLLTETAGLLNTARDNTTPAEIEDFSLEHDFEMEPSSPTHLLRNIERQVSHNGPWLFELQTK